MATTLTTLFTNIANAIRAKTGESTQIVAENFPAAIANITTGLEYIGTVGIAGTASGLTVPDNFSDATLIVVILSGTNIPVGTATELMGGMWVSNDSQNSRGIGINNESRTEDTVMVFNAQTKVISCYTSMTFAINKTYYVSAWK